MDPSTKADLVRRYNQCVAASSRAMDERAAKMLCKEAIFDSRGIVLKPLADAKFVPKLARKKQSKKHE